MSCQVSLGCFLSFWIMILFWSGKLPFETQAPNTAVLFYFILTLVSQFEIFTGSVAILIFDWHVSKI